MTLAKSYPVWKGRFQMLALHYLVLLGGSLSSVSGYAGPALSPTPSDPYWIGAWTNIV